MSSMKLRYRMYISIALLVMLSLPGNSFLAQSGGQNDASAGYNVLVRMTGKTVEQISAELLENHVPLNVAQEIVDDLAAPTGLLLSDVRPMASSISTPLYCLPGQMAEAAFQVTGPGLVSSKFTAGTEIFAQTDDCPFADGCFYRHYAGGDPKTTITGHSATAISSSIFYVYQPPYSGARCLI